MSGSFKFDLQAGQGIEIAGIFIRHPVRKTVHEKRLMVCGALLPHNLPHWTDKFSFNASIVWHRMTPQASRVPEAQESGVRPVAGAEAQNLESSVCYGTISETTVDFVTPCHASGHVSVRICRIA